MSYLKTKKKEECCGCKACIEICPQKCISMKMDDEYSYYPVINQTMCLECKLCEKVCPSEFNDFYVRENIEAFAGVHSSDDVINSSSSGGAFTAIYEETIKSGYKVYGVKFDEKLRVITDSAISLDECEKFRKSKYVQSDTNGCFEKIEYDLKKSKKLLFSGTPCQCAALKSYLKLKRIQEDDILIVSILCHGAPEQEVFNKYIEENSKKKKIVEFTFRSKIKAYGIINTRSALLKYEDGTKRVVDSYNCTYLRGYYYRLFYRKSCGYCQFAKPERISDLTIADAWGIGQQFVEFKNKEEKGVSLIISATQKGNEFVKLISENMELKKIDYNWVVQSQEILKNPTKMNLNREKFFCLIKDRGFNDAVNNTIFIPKWRIFASRMKHILFH